MADALGWSGLLDRNQTSGVGIPARKVPTSEHAPTVTGVGAGGFWIVNTRGDRGPDPAGGNEFGADGPSWALTGKARSWEVRTNNATSTGDTKFYPPGWPWTAPATTVAGDPRITARCHHEAGSQGANAVDIADVAAGVDPGDRPIRLTVRDALILQGFDPDYPVQGSRTKQFEQVGNAICPPWAAAIVAALTGADH